MKHTISVLVEDRFGELPRIIGLFSARGQVIESLTVSPTLEAKISSLTIVTSGDEPTIEKMVKVLNKQVRVLSAFDVTKLDHIEREMAFIKVKVNSETERQKVLNLASVFNAKVVDASEEGFIIEATGDCNTVRGLITALKPLGVQEVVRTGAVAIQRLPEAAEKMVSGF
ncbi:MAG: acetolactate synthase small subunit [Acidobacteria bacterium]|nr:acetolactate synthase small subunit [Acidobacteriota bacterium]